MLCVTIAERNFESCLSVIKNDKLYEIRLDKIILSNEEIEKLFKLPVMTIATCKTGGFFSNEECLNRLKIAIGTGAKYVDVEYESSENYRLELIELAKKNNCSIIISYHNFQQTPSTSELNEIATNCFKLGADIVKISTMINSNADNAKILSLYERTEKIISFGMGDKGKITRIIAPLLGAEFTYAAVSSSKTIAPGQLGKEEMLAVLNTLNDVC
ncbi:MAG: type I 3-dehydroquinate dehydratase [Bacteroidetes bacterium]|jgi:3-dehydroquinate dehydratase I|nr:type I 3-dehydroquinate dehydratase [Bacteroidota bacterium]MBT6686431.1 type I 3-dehydroquinate dehydratase [Bacteroidota bacterium]MBT7144670.1 type I 3-dehydroquinate dehydratase [Bacteroidota bacterium]MBT7491295.1 type I 3-dehydroquinate dehydratase [Bacteroidota bacterium]